MRTLAQDHKYGVRTLLKTPGFAAVAVLVLLREVGGVLCLILYLNPAIIEMNRKEFQQLNMPPAINVLNNPAWLNAVAIAKSFLPAAYAVTLLVMTLLPAVRAAFQAPRVQAHERDDDRAIVDDEAFFDRQEGNP